MSVQRVTADEWAQEQGLVGGRVQRRDLHWQCTTDEQRKSTWECFYIRGRLAPPPGAVCARCEAPLDGPPGGMIHGLSASKFDYARGVLVEHGFSEMGASKMLLGALLAASKLNVTPEKAASCVLEAVFEQFPFVPEAQSSKHG